MQRAWSASSFEHLEYFESVKREKNRRNEYIGEVRERNFKRQDIGVAFSNCHDDKIASHTPILPCGVRPLSSPLNGGDTPDVL